MLLSPFRARSRALALLSVSSAVLLLGAASSTRALADSPKAPSAAERKLAHRHFELAKTYYQQAAYGEALKYFEMSHKLSGEPALLFNVGRCYEALGKLALAIASYRAFLAQTKPNPDVEARISNLTSRLPKKEPPPRGLRPSSPAKPSAAIAAASPMPTKPAKPADSDAAGAVGDTRPPASASDKVARTWSWWTGWALAGAGLAALGAGVAFGVLAKNKADIVTAYYRDGDRDWAQVRAFEDKGKAYQTAQIATLIAGAAVAAGGAALLLFLPRRQRSSSNAGGQLQLAPMLASGTYGIAGALRF